MSDRTTTTKPKPRAKPRPTTTTRATTPTTAQQVVTKAPEEATLPAPPPPPPPPPTSPPTTVRGNCPKKGALTTINGGTWICEPQADGSLFWTPPPPAPPGTAVAQCPATPPRPDDAGCCNDGVTVAVPPVMLGQEQPTLDELCKAHGGAHVHYNGYP